MPMILRSFMNENYYTYCFDAKNTAKRLEENFYMVFTSSSYFLFVAASHRPKICVFSLIGLYVSDPSF